MINDELELRDEARRGGKMLLSLVVAGAVAGEKPVLGGYDMVAYFRDAQNATLGMPEFNYTLKTQDCGFDKTGSCKDRFSYDFWFASAAHRDAFAADPWAFAPKYGGF